MEALIKYSARYNYTEGGPNVRKSIRRPLGQPKIRLSTILMHVHGRYGHYNIFVLVPNREVQTFLSSSQIWDFDEN